MPLPRTSSEHDAAVEQSCASGFRSEAEACQSDQARAVPICAGSFVRVAKSLLSNASPTSFSDFGLVSVVAPQTFKRHTSAQLSSDSLRRRVVAQHFPLAHTDG